MLELIIGLGGVILGFALTMLWDRHKHRNRYKDLLEMVLFELRNTKKRVRDSLDGLPDPIRDQLDEKDYADLSPELVQEVPFSFPKPYTTDAWRTLVAAGFLTSVPKPLLSKLFALYDQIGGLNYIGKMSVELFKIVSRDNNLGTKMNRYLHSGSRLGVWGSLWGVHREIDDVIELLEEEVR